MAPLGTSAQSSTPPFLSITPQKEPLISVHGQPNVKYQLQYTPSLVKSNWQVLTNFILRTSPYTVVDPGVPAVGTRIYRALLLESNPNANYTPTTLSSGEIFRFSSSSNTGMETTDTLVLNSATSGLLIPQGAAPIGGISQVTITYSRGGPFLAQINVIHTDGPGVPMRSTNFYTLVFTGPGSGFFQATGAAAVSTVGEFMLDESLVGQQLAPAQLSAGEVYSLLTDNFGSSNLTTLVINSPMSGILISPADAAHPGAGSPRSVSSISAWGRSVVRYRSSFQPVADSASLRPTLTSWFFLPPTVVGTRTVLGGRR